MFLSLTRGTNLPTTLQSLISFDKAAHAMAYFVLAGLLTWGFHRRGSLGAQQAWLVILLASGYGVGVEVLQYTFFPYRYFEFLDIIANIIGSILGLFALKFFLK